MLGLVIRIRKRRSSQTQEGKKRNIDAIRDLRAGDRSPARQGYDVKALCVQFDANYKVPIERSSNAETEIEAADGAWCCLECG